MRSCRGISELWTKERKEGNEEKGRIELIRNLPNSEISMEWKGCKVEKREEWRDRERVVWDEGKVKR